LITKNFPLKDMETSATITKLSAAFLLFQQKAISASKANINPHFRTKYAGVNEVLEAVLGPLTENGLTVLQFPDGEHGLTTRLQHVSGEYMQASYPMKPSQATPQGVGSAMTYARRYALVAILGLGTEDDDGNAGSQAPKAAAQPAAAPAPSAANPEPLRAELRRILTALDEALGKDTDPRRTSAWDMLPTLKVGQLERSLDLFKPQLAQLAETGEVPV
jgi:hypothetical protein